MIDSKELAMHKFLTRLIAFGKISPSDKDMHQGIQSGNKKCCIDFFILCSSLGLPAGIMMDLVLGKDPQRKNGSVRCPKCRGVDNSTFDINEYVYPGGADDRWRKYYLGISTTTSTQTQYKRFAHDV